MVESVGTEKFEEAESGKMPQEEGGERPLLPLTSLEARQYSPLTLAFLGDAVYEREIRERVVLSARMTPNQLNKKSSALAKASTQAELVRLLQDELTDEETEVLKRGRNAHSGTMAKHATMADYRTATGLEALLGFLFLCGREKRLKDLITLGLQRLPQEAFEKDRN